MELVDVLNVSKHSVVTVGKTEWNIFWTACHLPQVRLCQEIAWLLAGTRRKKYNVDCPGTNLYALLQVSDIDSFCLKELCHDVPGKKQMEVWSCEEVVFYSFADINKRLLGTHSFLRAERLFSSLTWWLGSDRLTSGSESERLLGISSSSRSLLSWKGHCTFI